MALHVLQLHITLRNGLYILLLVLLTWSNQPLYRYTPLISLAAKMHTLSLTALCHFYILFMSDN